MQSPIIPYIIVIVFRVEGPSEPGGKKLQLICLANALLSISISRPICKGISPLSMVCGSVTLCVCVCVSVCWCVCKY